MNSKSTFLWLLLVGSLITRPLTAATIMVTSNGDSGPNTLRQAIANATDGDVIQFSGVSLITLTSNITINKSIAITGPGASQLTISGGNTTQVFYLTNSGIHISGLTIANGQAQWGAGAYLSVCSPTFTNCAFVGNATLPPPGNNNAGGGAMNNDRSSPVLINCSFVNNSAQGLFGTGGAIRNEGFRGNANPTLINCSFQNNSASYGGGAITVLSYDRNGQSHVTLVNCVFFANTGGTFSVLNDGTINASYCLFDAGSFRAGTGNLSTTTSPFVSPSSTQLNNCAPAINTGSNQAYTSAGGPTTDLASNARIFPTGGGVDMGAYEYQGPSDRLAFTSQPATGSAVCAGVSVSVPVSVSGSVSSYQWYKDGLALNGQASATLSLTSAQASDAGSYSLVVTGCNSVTSTAFSLSVSDPPTNASLGSGTLTCSVTSVTLTATGTGATSYTLSGGPTSQTSTTGQFVVSQAGTYTVTVSNASGCTATATSTVVSNTTAPTNVSLTSGALTCAQTSVTLTASSTGGTSYTLSDGQTSATGQFVVSQAGTYTVTVSNPSGCTATATSTVTNNTTTPMASLTASSMSACAPASITLTAGGGTSYTFSAGATQIGTSNQAIVTQSGTYSVTVSGATGCTATTSVSVTVNTPPAAPTLTGVSRTVDQRNTPLPLGQFVNATNGNTLSFSGVNGLLNPPNADVSQVGIQSFSVTQTSASGCVSPTTPFTITVQPTTPGSQTVCRSSQVVLSATTTGTRYEWYKNGTSAPFKLTEIASIQKGTATSSLTVVSIQTSASYYVKVFQANGESTPGSFTFDGPFVVTVNYGCVTPGARLAAGEAVVEVPLSVVLTSNPVEGGQLRAVVRGAGGQALGVELVNLRGEVVRQQVWPHAEAEQVVEWTISREPAGLYLLRAQTGSQARTAKVINP